MGAELGDGRAEKFADDPITLVADWRKRRHFSDIKGCRQCAKFRCDTRRWCMANAAVALAIFTLNVPVFCVSFFVRGVEIARGHIVDGNF